MASYSKTSWIGNELITAADLNRIENGIDAAITAVNTLNDNKVSTDTTIAVEHGGTGATTAKTARANLQTPADIMFIEDDNTWPKIWQRISDNIPMGTTANFWAHPNATKLITKNNDLNFNMRGILSRRYDTDLVFFGVLADTPPCLIEVHVTDASANEPTVGQQGVMIYRGGTPANFGSQPKMLVNLESSSQANVLVSESSPGVTGVLPIAHGGTNADTAAQALKNIGGMAYVNLNLDSGTLSDICETIINRIPSGNGGTFWASGTVAGILTSSEITTTLKGTIICPNANHIDIFAFTGDNSHSHKLVTINLGRDNDSSPWSIQKVAVFYTNPVLGLTATTAAGLYDQLITLPSGQSINVDFRASDAVKVLTNNKIDSGVVSGQVRRNASGDNIVFDFLIAGAGNEFIYTWRDTFTTAKVLTVGNIYKFTGTTMP